MYLGAVADDVTGGTDLASYYRNHEGFLIAAAIDKYVYITIHQTFARELIVKYSKMEVVPSAEQVKHPIVREALKLLQVPTLELQMILKQEIMQNPLLEEVDEVVDSEDLDKEDTPEEAANKESEDPAEDDPIDWSDYMQDGALDRAYIPESESVQEFLEKVPQLVFVSATPGPYELSKAGGVVVEQVDGAPRARPADGQRRDIEPAGRGDSRGSGASQRWGSPGGRCRPAARAAWSLPRW